MECEVTPQVDYFIEDIGLLEQFSIKVYDLTNSDSIDISQVQDLFRIRLDIIANQNLAWLTRDSKLLERILSSKYKSDFVKNNQQLFDHLVNSRSLFDSFSNDHKRRLFSNHLESTLELNRNEKDKSSYYFDLLNKGDFTRISRLFDSRLYERSKNFEGQSQTLFKLVRKLLVPLYKKVSNRLERQSISVKHAINNSCSIDSFMYFLASFPAKSHVKRLFDSQRFLIYDSANRPPRTTFVGKDRVSVIRSPFPSSFYSQLNFIHECGHSYHIDLNRRNIISPISSCPEGSELPAFHFELLYLKYLLDQNHEVFFLLYLKRSLEIIISGTFCHEFEVSILSKPIKSSDYSKCWRDQYSKWFSKNANQIISKNTESYFSNFGLKGPTYAFGHALAQLSALFSAIDFKFDSLLHLKSFNADDCFEDSIIKIHNRNIFDSASIYSLSDRVKVMLSTLD